uniref:Uncharacterized protein n=2 Tax=Cacopsylla melanoneura TaxID=428564 RepID=A0A8D8X0D7_9HEMI
MYLIVMFNVKRVKFLQEKDVLNRLFSLTRDQQMKALPLRWGVGSTLSVVHNKFVCRLSTHLSFVMGILCHSSTLVHCFISLLLETGHVTLFDWFYNKECCNIMTKFN